MIFIVCLISAFISLAYFVYKEKKTGLDHIGFKILFILDIVFLIMLKLSGLDKKGIIILTIIIFLFYYLERRDFGKADWD